MNAAELPAALQAWRRREGLSQRAAGVRLGVKLETVAAYERNRRFPSGPVLLKIIREIGLTLTAR